MWWFTTTVHGPARTLTPKATWAMTKQSNSATGGRNQLEPAVRAVVSEQFGGALVERPWLCDVMAVAAPVIQAHNRAAALNDEEIEPKFANAAPTPGRFSDLLWRDFEYLCKAVPWLSDYADRLAFVEIAGPSPVAQVLTVSRDAKPDLHVIGFRSPLLHFCHAVFSKAMMLMATYQGCDCLEEHKHILMRDEYSDTALLAGFFNDIEMLFDRKRLFVPIQPEHWAEPYDYCGRVEGARRFILAHELGHIVWNDPSRRPGPGHGVAHIIDPSHPERWTEELWCDGFAIQVILAAYGTEKLSDNRLYSAEDDVLGILTFTTIMDIVEVVLHKTNALSTSEYPPFALRETLVREAIKMHPLCAGSFEFQSAVVRVWRRLKVFSRYIGGLGVPDENGETWSKSGFKSRLSPFGLSAYNTISEKARDELSARIAQKEAAFQKNRRAIERGFMPDPRQAPRFDDVF
jgi:hypothetical protein